MAKGKKLKLIDGVVIADDGIIHFTDASYKHDLTDYVLGTLESKPHGRLMSYDPATKITRLLASDLPRLL